MRVIIIAAFAMMASGLAQPVLAGGSSIQIITTPGNTTPSVVKVSCSTCPPLSDAGSSFKRATPKLAQGTQHIDVRTVDGQRELVRTEAWLGGSPVVFINKQAGWLDNGSQLAGMPSDGVDEAAETAAVNHQPPALPETPLRLK
ncbi:plant virulence effector HPE1-like domain-containing protein [Rhizobium oryziradicis]|uniref:Uncharacterized protein n=1 Tax=Rhizobium oryziradicis TaxID=1867956 RepID=A0A1Q8ZUB2_9HYPH|nr:plant virulence effector HPE1-like domain-containing protein [Rhizobium oryziradicis]OLP45670.1 hypothetical protein BJF95_11015 [Rhizobium oryziradicis]